MGVAFFDSQKLIQYSLSIQDLSDPTDSQSIISDRFEMASDAGGDIFFAEFLKFKKTGAEFNFSLTNATVRKWPLLLIKAKR